MPRIIPERGDRVWYESQYWRVLDYQVGSMSSGFVRLEASDGEQDILAPERLVWNDERNEFGATSS